MAPRARPPLAGAAAALAVAAALAAPAAAPAGAHSLFNSAEEFAGGFRVQIATLPEFPQIGEPAAILLRVTDASFEEVGSFEAGMRVYRNGELARSWPPEQREGSHWETEFVFEEPGNHVANVVLYEGGREISYTFNIGTQSPFGYIFIGSITAGAVGLGVLMCVVYGPRAARRAGRGRARGGRSRGRARLPQTAFICPPAAAGA